MTRFEVGDEIQPAGVTEDGELVVRGRKRDGTILLARCLGSLREGVPIPREAHQIVSHHDGRVQSAVDLDHAGPVRVASSAYRAGYDKIFGSELPN